jgi:low affinity Fe/Cu permease
MDDMDLEEIKEQAKHAWKQFIGRPWVRAVFIGWIAGAIMFRYFFGFSWKWSLLIPPIAIVVMLIAFYSEPRI